MRASTAVPRRTALARHFAARHPVQETKERGDHDAVERALRFGDSLHGRSFGGVAEMERTSGSCRAFHTQKEQMRAVMMARERSSIAFLIPSQRRQRHVDEGAGAAFASWLREETSEGLT
jgi:hypothetical protein